MKHRYTTKKYDVSKKIDPTKINELKEILVLSPSSINSQPWKFTFVYNMETKNKLAKASFFNQQKIEDCDILIVLSRIDNLELFEKQIKENLPEGSVNYYNQFVKPLSKDQINAWFEKQIYLALGVLLSACAEMKIDSTPMEGIEPEKYDSILNSKDYKTIVAVAIGFHHNDDTNQLEKKPKSRKELNKVIEVI